MSQNNPIQERVDQLLLKWTLAINTPNVKIVRILAEEDEEEMLSAYYEYMLAIDTNQKDFVLVLSSPFSSPEEYGKLLLEELEEEISHWNEAKIPEGLKFETITWKPDYTLGSPINHAQLFIKNMNAFANYMDSEKKIKISIVLRIELVSEKDANQWFSQLLENNLEQHLIIGIDDTTQFPIFNDLAKNYPEEVYTIFPEFNMDEAIEQMAALGDPTSEDNSYRANLIKLMNGVKARNEKKVQNAAKACLDIAMKALKKDINWLGQIVTVYTILYNDQVGYKNYDEAIYFADKAVEAALLSKDVMDPEMSYRLIGQTHLGRGTLHNLKKNRDEAYTNYKTAADAYSQCNDFLMQCESLRLSGWMADKLYEKELATQHYLEAYHLKKKIPEDVIKTSAFPLIIKQLMNSSERQKHLTDTQMNDDLIPIFGEEWRESIEKFGTLDKKNKTIHQ